MNYQNKEAYPAEDVSIVSGDGVLYLYPSREVGLALSLDDGRQRTGRNPPMIPTESMPPTST